MKRRWRRNREKW